METQDIFKVNTDEDQVKMDLDSLFSDEDFTDLRQFDSLDGYDQLLFNPSHVNIDNSTIVDLIHNGLIMKTVNWKQMILFINEKWATLNGTYQVSQDGMVLHTFTVAHHTG